MSLRVLRLGQHNIRLTPGEPPTCSHPHVLPQPLLPVPVGSSRPSADAPVLDISVIGKAYVLGNTAEPRDPGRLQPRDPSEVAGSEDAGSGRCGSQGRTESGSRCHGAVITKHCCDTCRPLLLCLLSAPWMFWGHHHGRVEGGKEGQGGHPLPWAVSRKHNGSRAAGSRRPQASCSLWGLHVKRLWAWFVLLQATVPSPLPGQQAAESAPVGDGSGTLEVLPI